MSRRTTYSLLGVLVVLVVIFAFSGTALATTFSTPVDAHYTHISNSVYLSQDDFAGGAPAAVLAGSEAYAPALVSTVLANAVKGPLLLTSSTALSSDTQAELVRLKPTTVYAVGLSATIVTAVQTALPAATIVPLTGADQYQTAALVAAQVKTLAGKTPTRVFIVPGDVCGSSVSAGPIAAANGWPILLTPQSGTFSTYTAQAITSLGVTSGVEVDTSVDPGVAGFSVSKVIMGSSSTSEDPGNRYSETVQMAEYAVQQGWATYAHLGFGEEEGPSVAYSANFPDNVLVASHTARVNGVYVLSNCHGLITVTSNFLKTHGPDIDSVDFMRADYDNLSSTAWSFGTIREVKALNSPRVTALSKTSGALAGGGSLTITGTGFTGATTVRLGKTDLPGAAWHVVSSTSITIDSVPSATQPGATEALVSNYWNFNPSSPADAYFYADPGSPALTAMTVVQEAVKYLGVPYTWGGASTSGFDCSGFTSYVYNKHTSLTGVTLPHKASYQASYGTPVAQADLLPGDLVFFGTTGIGHVGIYVGNGLMINSPRSGDLVCIEDVYRSNYVSARRLISPYNRIQQDNSLLAHTGAWTIAEASTSASGGSLGYADAAGSSITVSFTGTYLQWIAKTSTSYGLARVTLDGADMGTVNLYSSTAVWQKKVWSTGTLANGPHTVVISWTGTAGATGGGTNIGVDAFDVIGTYTQAHAAGVATRYQDTDRNVLWTGLWGNTATSSASGACFRSINAAGSAAITFDGTTAAWVATKGPGYGKAHVTLDGADAGTIDLYSAATVYGQTVWSATGLAAGTHTLSVEWTGDKNASASAAAIDVDAFDVTGTLTTPAGLTRYEQTDSHLVYAGTWSLYSTTSASGGSYSRANTAASVTAKFSGTYLSWVATAGTTTGTAKVSLDGGPTQTIDLARSAVAYQRSLWATGVLDAGQHTVVITRDTANASGKYVDADAFDIIGALNDGAAAGPAVTSLGPTSGTTAGGTSVTITGTGFTGATAVTFGGAAAAGFTVNSATTIRAQTPAHAGGLVDVRVTAPAGTSANTAADDFTYVTPSASTRYEQTDPNIVETGTWEDFYRTEASGGSYGRAASSGSAVTIYFNGTRLDWIAMKGTSTGIADVYLDGVKKATVDLKATSLSYQVNAWSTGTIAAGEHYVTIARSGTSATGKYVTVDAVDITGTISAPPHHYEETDGHIVKVGSWNEYTKAAASGGSYGRSNTSSPAQASATIYFTGTRLDWIAMKGTTAGVVDVYLDGRKVTTITLTATTPTYNLRIWSTGTLSSTTHTVRLVRTGTGSLFLTLDAVDIWGTIAGSA